MQLLIVSLGVVWENPSDADVSTVRASVGSCYRLLMLLLEVDGLLLAAGAVNVEACSFFSCCIPGLFCCPDSVVESSAPVTLPSCWLVSQCCCQCCGTWLVSSWTSSVGCVVGAAVAAEVVALVSPIDGFRSGFG
ncbi:hypothetical protein Nepgr_021685 [Nepenthes gracilis]|uniref:Uncharacterized protein n=1 Tax=Nepenthes gracilis TaxID=150966 RepID=A0AAD3XXA1_NEPGR|nr:hypothetical protein Nepgr_021685 [Nepenthes gracilis]